MVRFRVNPEADGLPERGDGAVHPPEARPRERLQRFGPGPLSEHELLALVIGSGSGSISARTLAEQVLGLSGGRLNDLAQMDPGRLVEIPGIGFAVAARIVAAIELGRRVGSARSSREDPITGPADVHDIFAPTLGHLAHEEFHILLLNSQNIPICQRQVTKGILDASLIHPREVFRDAIVLRAAALILVHNHPSGNPEPSAEDLKVTRQLCEAGDQIGIPVLDHIIVAGGSFSSLAGRGCLRGAGR
ncbi:MAG: DNA repair protein RadC [Gemmatimonadetes bacterium]|nr:DNA repair protein RadC [Gemmatimonadota bacterium]MYA63713.1 DNA repair protein RadC [Gemmatimonadota bacterium]MYB99350.1 DNA repair protein RadC [Gemmatimonadota bacterium]MYH52349.1 DNA repair protein RadC [Gemmatimonadota bacterium]MYK67901.1 DNA repair protein RadC [Gemmatimonadota bacterium]